MSFKAFQTCDECGLEVPASFCYGDPCLPDNWGYDNEYRDLCENCLPKFPPPSPSPSAGSLSNLGAALIHYLPPLMETLGQARILRNLKEKK